MTEILPATSDGIARAAELLRSGALVSFGTETVYGLGGDATNAAAVAAIFAAKGLSLIHILNEQLKPQADQGQRMSLPREQPQSPATAPPMDDAEQQMRRALGLYGDTPRPRPENDRSEPAQRAGGGFMQGVHRRRFVQDGEVPVTVVRREAPDAAHPGSGQTAPTSSRLQRVEAALAAETAARERAERAPVSYTHLRGIRRQLKT